MTQIGRERGGGAGGALNIIPSLHKDLSEVISVYDKELASGIALYQRTSKGAVRRLTVNTQY